MWPSHTDSASFAVSGNSSQPLTFGYHAVLDGHMVTQRLAREFPPVAADLMEIAASVYAVDRLVPRPGWREIQAGSTWAREIVIKLPVRQPDLWDVHAEHLTDLLTWLTDDQWRIEFFQLSEGAGPLDEPQGFLFDTVPAAASPILFSGGLDSAIGLAAHLANSDAVAISVHTNGQMRHVQNNVLAQMHYVGAYSCIPLRYRINVPAKTVESSQRSRGFLFLATGISTSWAMGQDRLCVYENGIGAINLPYLRSQFGSQATKSMHPRTLRLIESLASGISSHTFHIDAPHIAMTKAQTIRLAPAAAEGALRLSVSCDTGFSARVKGNLPCGKCTSCLLRRQSLLAAQREDLDDPNAYRIKSPEGTPTLEAMLWQVDRLRSCLNQQNPWSGLVSEFPEILDAVSIDPIKIVELYRSYVQEWDSLEGGPWISQRPWQSRTAAL